MAKFIIECPECGSYAEASNFLFAKKKVNCGCGYTINVNTDKISVKTCAQCGNDVVYDQSKKDKALCTVCKYPLNTTESLTKVEDITCPTCSCNLKVDKSAESYECPICDTNINVQERIAKAKLSKSGVVSLIKYEGDNNTLVWKHPIEDFNMGSQLIVHETQEALFFRNGQALDLFPSGRYTLETQKLPMLDSIFTLPTSQEGTFHSEVYFINQTTQMAIKWGTDSKVRLFDPASGLHVELGASGEFNLRVQNSRKLVLKLVGTTGKLVQSDVLSSGFTGMTGHFRALVMTQVKTYLAKTIKEKSINILEIDEHLEIISSDLKEKINTGLEPYGLIMPEFYVMRIVTPDDDPNFRRMKEQYAERYIRIKDEGIKKAEAEASTERMMVEAERDARLKIIAAQGDAEAEKIMAAGSAEAYRLQAEAEAKEMQMKGYTYGQETARKIGVGAVQGGSGNSVGQGGGVLGDVVNLGVSLGAISGVMGITKDAMSPITQNTSEMASALQNGMKEINGISNSETWDCSCGNKGISGKFCGECGNKKPEPPKSWDCSCGNKGIVANFCGECGSKKPEPPKSWDCSCGNKGITAKFCGECGAKKIDNDETWNCSCGNNNITAKFCPECGSKR